MQHTPAPAGTAAGTPCAWDGCDGALEADGFCDTCGRSAPPAAAAPVTPAPPVAQLPAPRAAPEATAQHGAPTVLPGNPPGTAPAGTQHGAPTVMPTAPRGGTAPTGGRWSGPLSTGPTSAPLHRGGGTDDIPPVPRIDPSSALLRDPQVPERDRYCRHGGTPHPVGRSREGRPGLVRGFCPQDGTPYSFAPPLAQGSLVAGQYEVRGALAHGGLGWIYLAVDRNVDDRWVVLKGVLDANDPAALAAARAERQFLAQLSHPNIVAIHNFVRHVENDDMGREHTADYIVMAYIGGSTLAQVRDARADQGVLPVAHALTYMIKVLPALGYLHAEGHVYSDFKPDNVMQCERHLTLIDMGAVARIDDADAVVYGTVGYHAPEVVRAELSPASDLYTVGRTLAVLALGIEPARGGVETELPDDHPLLLRHESLHRLLLRATHPDPLYRFGSADEMAEQLDGVRREVLAVDEQRPRPAPSAVFSAPRGTFAPGLLLPDAETGPGRPAAALIAGRLPEPLDAVQTGPDDWRHRWSAALAALATGDLDTARAAFDALYSTFPGELAPKLALAAVAECAADDDSAQRYYQLVAAVDPSWADAAFGLARTWLRAGRRADAVAALLAVPASSSGHVAARRAAVEATLLRHDAGSADDDELRAAAALLEQLDLDPLTMQRMRVAVLDAAVERVGARPGEPVLGCAWEERALRLELERSLRALARLTPDRAEKITLVDRANTAHPRTLR